MFSINFAKTKGNNSRQDTHKPTFETMAMKQHATYEKNVNHKYRNDDSENRYDTYSSSVNWEEVWKK